MSNNHKNMNSKIDDNSLINKLSSNNDIKKFLQFLTNHKTDEKENVTHTTLGKMFGLYNSKFCIDDCDQDKERFEDQHALGEK